MRRPWRGAARGEGGDGMITVPAGIRVLVATKPVDFCRGADSLAALVREQLQHDPFSGTIYIFCSKRAAFRWPPISDGVMRLSASQLAALVDGMDWSRLYARDIAQPTATS